MHEIGAYESNDSEKAALYHHGRLRQVHEQECDNGHGETILRIGLWEEREVSLRWNQCYAAALMLAVSTSAGSAAELPCFELYQNANATGPEGSILLNKCTGETWLLVGVNAGSGSSLGWHRIPVDMSSDGAQTVPMAEDGARTDTDAAYAD